jgi:hypothetical protein
MHVIQNLFGPNYFVSSALKVPQSDFIQNMSQAPSKSLTPSRPLRQTSFTYPKLNMDNFSGPGGPLGYRDSTQEVEWNSLHAERGIGKGKGSGIMHIR